MIKADPTPVMATESAFPRNQQETPRGTQAEPPKDASNIGEFRTLDQPAETMHLLPEPESARKKRKRKGLLRKILGDCPFIF